MSKMEAPSLDTDISGRCMDQISWKSNYLLINISESRNCIFMSAEITAKNVGRIKHSGTHCSMNMYIITFSTWPMITALPIKAGLVMLSKSTLSYGNLYNNSIHQNQMQARHSILNQIII